MLIIIEWLQQAEWEGKTLQVDMRNYDHETALGPGLHPSLKSPGDRSGSSNHSPTGPDGNTMSLGAYQVQYAQYQPQAQVSASPAYGTVQGGYAQQYTYINTVSKSSCWPCLMQWDMLTLMYSP